MSDSAVEAQITQLEMLLLKPEIRRDRARVEELLAQDFLEFGASGRVWTREEILEELATEIYLTPVAEDISCQMLGERVALVTYRTIREQARGAEPTEVLRSSVWIQKDKKWRIRFHQGTRRA